MRSWMNAIEKIVDILKQYPGIQYEFRADAIRALAPDESGYEVALLMHPQPYYTVCLATWDMEFADEDSAIGTFLGGLTEAYRLEVTVAGEWTISGESSIGSRTGGGVEAPSGFFGSSSGEGRKSDVFKITFCHCHNRRTDCEDSCVVDVRPCPPSDNSRYQDIVLKTLNERYGDITTRVMCSGAPRTLKMSKLLVRSLISRAQARHFNSSDER
jgi:hypothetical protein